MRTVFNVIYRDLSATTQFRCSARRTPTQAKRLEATLKARGWDVIVDDQQPEDGAAINAPIVDVRAALDAERHKGIIF